MLNTAIAATLWCGAIAHAGATQSALLDALKKHYRPAKIAIGSHDIPRPENGSAVIVQRSGISSVPEADTSFLDVCPSVFRGGEIHPTPGAFCSDLADHSQKLLDVSDRAYVTALQVNTQADKISFYLARCVPCTPAKSLVYYRSLVVFEFPKGYLSKADPDEIVKAADQVLTPEAEPSTEESKGAAVATVRKGQSPEQVVAALGKPDAIVDLETRLVYLYRAFKLVFTERQLTDVQ